jgi:hypothetical protein
MVLLVRLLCYMNSATRFAVEADALVDITFGDIDAVFVLPKRLFTSQLC